LALRPAWDGADIARHDRNLYGVFARKTCLGRAYPTDDASEGAIDDLVMSGAPPLDRMIAPTTWLIGMIA
jgi:hypothetical protein